jgi:hypothetical protein
MLNITSSKATRTSERFQEVRRRKGQDNLAWIGSILKKTEPGVNLLLAGGVGPSAFRLRVAQAHLRHDLSPSHWSDVAMLEAPAKSLAATRIYEISLEPEGGFGFPPPANAVQVSRLARYRDAGQFPNIALITIPVNRKDVATALKDFQKQRVIDTTELLVLWLAFAWGVGRTGNPLLDGNGIPSATMIESVISAAGFDLTPGLESRSSCPEAIWQAVRWWHEYYEQVDKQPPSGAWHMEHYLMAR